MVELDDDVPTSRPASKEATPMDVESASDATTDVESLREHAYPDGSNLLARRSFFDHRRPRLDLAQWAMQYISVPPNGIVLDTGCGPGIYLEKLRQSSPATRAVGIDISNGMLQEARERLQRFTRSYGLLNADLQNLPFATATFDVIIAAHVLFHIPDLRRGLAELRRVLRPQGALAVVVNGPIHLAELSALLTSVSRKLWVHLDTRIVLPGHGHALSGWMKYLEQQFNVDSYQRTHGVVTVTHAEPAISYLRSARAWIQPQLPRSGTWAQFESAVTDAVDQAISTSGAWSTSVEAAIFTCSPASQKLTPPTSPFPKGR